LAWKFAPDRPVYIQISDRIKQFILSGEYAPGEQIPTVRQIALDAAVNPNTVQRAFNELEGEGLIIPHGTLGRFVTDNTEKINNCRHECAKETVKAFINEMKKLSISDDEISEMVKEAFE
jgi:DNA-binding transcriptional regulator YhcF (GntR family)